MGQDARAERDLLVEVTLSETITTELKLRRVRVGEISIEDAQGVEFCDMVAAHLVSSDQQLSLKHTTVRACRGLQWTGKRTFK